MPPSASAAATLAENEDNHRAPPESDRQGSDSESGNVDDDDEEEEEEEEEEEIEYEEVEEEIDEEEEDAEENSSYGNDISSTVESNGNDRKLGSDYFTEEKCEAVIPLPSEKIDAKDNNVNSKSSSPPRTAQKEDQSMEFEVSKYPASAVGDKDVDARSHLRVGEIVNGATSSSNVSGKEMASSTPVKSCSGEVVNVIPQVSEEVGLVDMQSAADDRKRMASRCAAPDMGMEVQSSGVDFNTKNKRPAIICDFFARGWCIKGSSCRFLHVKDNVDNADQKHEGVVSPANDKQQVRLLNEGTVLQKQDENQRLHSFPEDKKFSFMHREYLSMGHSPDFKQYPSSKGDMGSFQDLRRDSEGQNLPADNYSKSSLFNTGSSPLFRSSTLVECRSSLNGPVVYSGNNFQSRNQSSNISCLEEMTHHGFHRLNSHLSIGSSHILASRFSNTFPANGISPSCSGSTWMGASSFPYPLGSEPGKFPSMNMAGDPLRSADYKAKISSDDWEPSVPFQPSFFIIPSTSSSQGQYDPLRDSSDLPNTGDRDFKFSFSAPVTSAPNATYQRAYVDSTSTGVPIPECNGDKSTALNRIQKEAKAERISVGDIQVGKLVKEESTSGASHVNGNSKTGRVDASSKCKQDKQDSIVEETAENNEKVVEQKHDDHMLKDSKAAKLFRAALIDFVKELLKPTWLEGRLSKDAHNTIVKKAVEKVVSSFQPHQIPATTESAKQYLSLSEPKIMKLIKGYVERYGKS